MKRTISLLIVSAFISINPLYSKKLAVLPEVGKPLDIAVKNGKLFISDKTVKVHVYSLKDFKYQVQISSRGEGPGECKIGPIISVGSDYIFLYSMGKGILFSGNGKLISEIKAPSIKTSIMSPVGKNFVCLIHDENKRNKRYYYDFSIYTPTNKQELTFKNIMYYYDYPPRKKRGGKWDYDVIKEYVDYLIYDNKVFIGDSTRGLFVEVFDRNGNKINRIKLDTEKVKVTEEYKNKLSNLIEKDPLWRSYGKSLYNLVFPLYCPAFYRFSVDNGKIYFLTYLLKDEKREVIIADLKGNLLKRTYVPWIEDGMRNNYSIENDKFYYIVENEETEDWELHMEEIK
jgi:hypothetical protein